MWWNCLKSHISNFLLILAIDSRYDHGCWFPNEKSIKERLGVICKDTQRKSTEAKLRFEGRFAKNSQKCFSCREGNLGQGDDLILGSRINKRQRSAQRGSAEKQESSSRKGNNCATQVLRSPSRTAWFVAGNPRRLRRDPKGQCRDSVTQSGVTQPFPGQRWGTQGLQGQHWGF